MEVGKSSRGVGRGNQTAPGNTPATARKGVRAVLSMPSAKLPKVPSTASAKKPAELLKAQRELMESIMAARAANEDFVAKFSKVAEHNPQIARKTLESLGASDDAHDRLLAELVASRTSVVRSRKGQQGLRVDPRTAAR